MAHDKETEAAGSSTAPHTARALIVKVDEGWEGLWIDGQFIKQYHHLEEGNDRGLWFLALAEKHGLKFSDFQEAYANEKAEPYLELGSLPEDYEEILQMIELQEQQDAEYTLS